MSMTQASGISYFETSGYSMEPLIKSGDRVLAWRHPVSTLRIGDIIIAEIAGRATCHRLVHIKRMPDGATLFLRGDASFSRPDPVPEHLYMGKVTAIIKPGGTITLQGAAWRAASIAAIYIFPAYMGLRRLAAAILGR